MLSLPDCHRTIVRQSVQCRTRRSAAAAFPCLLDCSPIFAGGGASIVTSIERFRDLDKRPIRLLGAMGNIRVRTNPRPVKERRNRLMSSTCPTPPASAAPAAAPSAAESFHPPGPAKAQDQDWAALRAHLAASGLALDRNEYPRQFAGGLANLNYLIKIDGKPWVLRRPPPGDLPPGANDMRREYSILRNLGNAFPLAPKAIHFSDDKNVIGAPFLIMEYRPGLVIGGSLPAARPTTAEERLRLGLQLVELLADLHAVDAAAVGLSALGRPEGMLVRMVEGWTKRAQLACSSTARGTPAGIESVARWLRAQQVAERKPSLLHSDYKLDNVILDPVSLAPRAVIDWDMGTRGDPLVDLATLLSYWTEPGDPEPMHELGQMPTAEPGFPSRDEVLRAYALRTGADLSGFRFYRVLAMFKLTVVFMQLHARYLRGEVTLEKFRTFGKLSAGLLDCTRAMCAGEIQ